MHTMTLTKVLFFGKCGQNCRFLFLLRNTAAIAMRKAMPPEVAVNNGGDFVEYTSGASGFKGELLIKD